MIKSLKLTNFLSFGPDSPAVELGPLNVLIGANGSGKSNFLAVFDILKNAPSDISLPIRSTGGVAEWLWKGSYTKENRLLGAADAAEIELELKLEMIGESVRTLYSLMFGDSQGGFDIHDEVIENLEDPNQAYSFLVEEKRSSQSSKLVSLDHRRSLLAQRAGPEYVLITLLGFFFRGISVYREWVFGPYAPYRTYQRTDLPMEQVESDGSNLANVLHRILREPDVKESFLKHLQVCYDGITDIDVDLSSGGNLQVFLREGRAKFPATRLSDGTMRYIWLLAVLCNPQPPPLVCIEEPELGAHPDIVRSVAELLQEASERCQLIVTTHSVNLVDAMTETPEAVLVCEKDEKVGTVIRRPKNLASWVEEYRLGDLWTSGEIGGNRW